MRARVPVEFREVAAEDDSAIGLQCEGSNFAIGAESNVEGAGVFQRAMPSLLAYRLHAIAYKRRPQQRGVMDLYQVA